MAGFAARLAACQHLDLTAAEQAKLQRQLDAAWPEFKADWPRLDVERALFETHLEAALAGIAPVEIAGRTLSDLVMARLLAEGSHHALKRFEQRFGATVLQWASTMGRGLADPEEIRAAVWRKLWVGTTERGPLIRLFNGRGTLAGWLKVVVARAAVDALRRLGPVAEPMDQSLSSAVDDPEMEFLKRHYSAAFEGALRSAVANLAPRDRALLALAYVDGFDTPKLAVFYGVHRTSAGRWLADARGRLLRATRRGLIDVLRVSSSELDSIIRLIESRMEITFTGLLAGADDDCATSLRT